MNPATVDDVAAGWRPLTPAELTVAQSLLDYAWQILLVRIPDLESRMTAGTPSSALVRGVVCAMVLRVLRNPDGKRQEAIDDYSWTRDNAVSAGMLYVDDAELKLLWGRRGSAFSITPGYC